MADTKELREKLKVMLPRTKAGNDMLRAIISMAKQKGREEIEGKMLNKKETIKQFRSMKPFKVTIPKGRKINMFSQSQIDILIDLIYKD